MITLMFVVACGIAAGAALPVVLSHTARGHLKATLIIISIALAVIAVTGTMLMIK